MTTTVMGLLDGFSEAQHVIYTLVVQGVPLELMGRSTTAVLAAPAAPW